MADLFRADQRIAAGYADDRPFLHSQVLEMALRDLAGRGRFLHGLDVGCGAGLSARALLPYCRHVTGTDLSGDMIQAARAHDAQTDCTFVQCGAEELQCLEEVYEIVTAAGVTDWIDIGRFLDALVSVVREGSRLLVYDFWITDRMEGRPQYTKWWHEQYLQKFPLLHCAAAGSRQEWADGRFVAERQEHFVLSHTFSLAAFVRFLLLQSNVSAWICAAGQWPGDGEGQDGSRAAEAAAWMEETLAPVFAGEAKVLSFDGYYRRFVYHGRKKDTGTGQGRTDIGG